MMVSDMEYIKMAEDTFTEALSIARSDDGWKVEKEDKANEVLVECKKNAKGKKVYRCKAKIPMPASLLAAAIKDTDKITSWNYTLTEARVLKKINDNVAVSYQITTDAAGGMVSARDFIYLSQVGYEGEQFIMGGKSVEFEGGPKSSKIVRAINGPGCQIVTPFPGDPNCCTFLWLMDCEYKGMMLQSILDIALPIAQTSFVECIKKLGAKLKEEGKF